MKRICPVCGAVYDDMDDDYDTICLKCGWEEDSVQEADPSYENGANVQSLNQYKALWDAKQK